MEIGPTDSFLTSADVRWRHIESHFESHFAFVAPRGVTQKPMQPTNKRRDCDPFRFFFHESAR
jgi:hypothetical protein